MKSTFDNCILLNAILKNQSVSDDPDADYLWVLQELHNQIVDEYYSRSEVIIRKMRELDLDNMETWTEICDTYVKQMLIMIKDKQYNDLVPAIRFMLNSLEAQYGVE
jgi:hypothetical protein